MRLSEIDRQMRKRKDHPSDERSRRSSSDDDYHGHEGDKDSNDSYNERRDRRRDHWHSGDKRSDDLEKRLAELYKRLDGIAKDPDSKVSAARSAKDSKRQLSKYIDRPELLDDRDIRDQVQQLVNVYTAASGGFGGGGEVYRIDEATRLLGGHGERSSQPYSHSYSSGSSSEREYLQRIARSSAPDDVASYRSREQQHGMGNTQHQPQKSAAERDAEQREAKARADTLAQIKLPFLVDKGFAPTMVHISTVASATNPPVLVQSTVDTSNAEVTVAVPNGLRPTGRYVSEYLGENAKQIRPPSYHSLFSAGELAAEMVGMPKRMHEEVKVYDNPADMPWDKIRLGDYRGTSHLQLGN
jgi:hypothetical protein